MNAVELTLAKQIPVIKERAPKTSVNSDKRRLARKPSSFVQSYNRTRGYPGGSVAMATRRNVV